MTRTDGEYDRRTYLRATTAAVVGAVGLTGCLGTDGGGGGDGGSDEDGGDGGGGGSDDEFGTLSTLVTDDPGDIDDFDSCVVSIVGYWLGPAPDEEGTTSEATTAEGTATADDAETTAGGTATPTATVDGTRADAEETDVERTGTEITESDDEGGREYHELDEPATADLVELQDGTTQLVTEDELATGGHAFLQLDTDGVDATLKSGESATVEVPGEAPVTFDEAFEIRADTRTTFTADFTPVRRGRTGEYVLQPVPSGITVTYEAVDDGETTAPGDGDGTTEPDDGETTAPGETDDGTTAVDGDDTGA